MEDRSAARYQPLNLKTLRRALRDWDSLKALGEHPLAALTIVQTRHQAAGYSPTSTGRGLAVREELQSALDQLKPDDGTPVAREKRWRPYIILTEQYRRGRSPEWVRAQLHLSKAAYYAEQERALELLVNALQRREEEQCRQSQAKANELERGRSAVPVPFMTPSRSTHALVGRAALLSDLKHHLIEDQDRALTALNGLPGVGKTTLAIEIAHDPDILAHFSDGVLWAGLGRQPDVLAWLSTWAEAMGVPAESMTNHSNIAERAALVHAAIGRRRMLLIIDDAWQIEAALALRVGGPNCAHLMTTRLADVALDFANDSVTTVHELDTEEGLDLLMQLSPRAVQADPATARTLVQSVGGLPLALVLMGHYLHKRSYSAQARRVHDALTRLQTVTARLQLALIQPPPGAPADVPLNASMSLQAAIGLSDAALDATAHRALIDLSIFAPKPNTFSEDAALAVIAAPVEVLDTLVDRGLVESVEPDHYTLHQTIADYAALQRADSIAHERLAGYFLRFVEANADRYAVLERELGNISTALDAAFEIGQHDQLIRLIDALYQFLDLRGLYRIAERQLHRVALTAESNASPGQKAMTLYRIGDLDMKRGRFKQARVHLQRSIELAGLARARELEADACFKLGMADVYAGEGAVGRTYLEQALRINREVGYRESESFTLNSLGFAYEELCDFDRALAYLNEALQAARDSGSRRAEGWAHCNLGMVYLPLGDFAVAYAHAEQCLSIYRELGDRRGEGWELYHLGRVLRQLGCYDEALACFEQALHILSAIGDGMGIGFALHNIGLIRGELGDDDAAQAHFEQALAVFRRDSSSPVNDARNSEAFAPACQSDCAAGEAQTLHSLGVLRRRHGDYAGARPLLEQALEFRRKVGYRRGEAMTLANLGLTCQHLGDEGLAMRYAQQAVDIARDIRARPTHAYTLTFLGHMLLDASCLDEAEHTYSQAAALRRAMNQPHLLIDPLAGLGQVWWRQGQLDRAVSAIDEILDYLNTLDAAHGLAGADDASSIYWIGYRIFDVVGNGRARTLLHTACDLLHQRAARLGDEEERRAFLEHVPVHQAILEAAQRDSA